MREFFPEAVIVRPSIVFSRDSNFVISVREMARYLPVMGVPKPSFRFQPVHIDDLVEVILRVVEQDLKGLTVNVCGPEVFTAKELFKLALRTTGVSRPVVGVPLWTAIPVVHVVEKMFPWLNVSSDSLKSLAEEDNVCENTERMQEILGRPLKSIKDQL